MSTAVSSYNKRARDVEEEDPLDRFLKEAEQEDDNYEVYESVHKRKENIRSSINDFKMRKLGNKVNSSEDILDENDNDANTTNINSKKISLLDQAAELKKSKGLMDKKIVKQEKQQESELALLKEANQVQTNALQSNEEIATGIRYTERLKTRWAAPKYLLNQPEENHTLMRSKWHIIVEGENCK